MWQLCARKYSATHFMYVNFSPLSSDIHSASSYSSTLSETPMRRASSSQVYPKT